ncbi:MAG: hypothetical protein OIF38_09020 [Cellvibrionaceae bacterium]|nr:hypothetical protein [Cellvibrionaceae bacterium]
MKWFKKDKAAKTDTVKPEPGILEGELSSDMSLPEAPDELEAVAAPRAQAEQQAGVGQRIGATVSAPVRGLSRHMQRKIRNKAIERARTRILIAGQKPENLPAETLEIVVREEEDKIKSQIKEKGLLFVIASLGLGWWM